ncbi:MAG: hypothetical protein MI861_12035 [Pirellulales bacterium]|nr:hypothetical protein [Pirellulales bacterium]
MRPEHYHDSIEPFKHSNSNPSIVLRITKMGTQLHSNLGTPLGPTQFLNGDRFDTTKHNLKDSQVIYKKNGECRLRGDAGHSWRISWRRGGTAQFEWEKQMAINEVGQWLEGLGVESKTFSDNFSSSKKGSASAFMTAGQLKAIVKEAKQELSKTPSKQTVSEFKNYIKKMRPQIHKYEAKLTSSIDKPKSTFRLKPKYKERFDKYRQEIKKAIGWLRKVNHPCAEELEEEYKQALNFYDVGINIGFPGSKGKLERLYCKDVMSVSKKIFDAAERFIALGDAASKALSFTKDKKTWDSHEFDGAIRRIEELTKLADGSENGADHVSKSVRKKANDLLMDVSNARQDVDDAGWFSIDRKLEKLRRATNLWFNYLMENVVSGDGDHPDSSKDLK